MVQTWAGKGDIFTSGCPYQDTRPLGTDLTPCLESGGPPIPTAPEHAMQCQAQRTARDGALPQPRARHPTDLGAPLQAPMHKVPRPQGTAGSLPPTWPSLGAEPLPGRPGLPRWRDTGCGEGVVGVQCRGLTCETPESPSGWTWSPPGSAEGPAHSALSSSSGTRGLRRDKAAALKG